MITERGGQGEQGRSWAKMRRQISVLPPRGVVQFADHLKPHVTRHIRQCHALWRRRQRRRRRHGCQRQPLAFELAVWLELGLERPGMVGGALPGTALGRGARRPRRLRGGFHGTPLRVQQRARRRDARASSTALVRVVVFERVEGRRRQRRSWASTSASISGRNGATRASQSMAYSARSDHSVGGCAAAGVLKPVIEGAGRLFESAISGCVDLPVG